MRSSDSVRQKVIIVGPSEAGKSTLANILAETADGASESYYPTEGVRILEHEASIRSMSSRLTVELWDLSGDTKYQQGWPAIKKDACGCILVYNPEKLAQEQEIERWLQWFPRALTMTPRQVMVVQAMRRSDQTRAMPLPGKLVAAGIGTPVVLPVDDLCSARAHFSQFLEVIHQTYLDKQRQEEEDVMQG